jgi:hypothetical protein
LVEATINFGGVYNLNEFKVYLYKDGLSKFGSGFEVQVLFGGEWTTVIKCESTADMEKYLVKNQGGVGDWLIFRLNDVYASKLKFVIPNQTEGGWTTFYEMECFGVKSTKVDPNGGEEPAAPENVLEGKQFVPTDAALDQVLVASWWKGGGYEDLTDGIKNADNAAGRFSTAMALTGMMDATIDLGGVYDLQNIRFYTYDPAAGTGAGSLGSDLLIQIYSNGEWIDVITCADNASIASYLVVNEGTYNDYLEFNLGGVAAEKIRFYISASASSSGTTYEEIECSGYAK